MRTIVDELYGYPILVHIGVGYKHPNSLYYPYIFRITTTDEILLVVFEWGGGKYSFKGKTLTKEVKNFIYTVVKKEEMMSLYAITRW